MTIIYCPVCGKNIKYSTFCPRCGYDECKDYEVYPTISKIEKGIKSIEPQRQTYETETLEKNIHLWIEPQINSLKQKIEHMDEIQIKLISQLNRLMQTGALDFESEYKTKTAAERKDNTKKINNVSKTYDSVFVNAQVGDIIIFGSYKHNKDRTDQKKDIEWIVLEKEYSRILLISKYVLDNQSYNEKIESVTWETCSLRRWLNTSFLEEAFNFNEKEMISESQIANDKNPIYRISGNQGNYTTDKIFLLSIKDMKKYFTSELLKQCVPTEYAISEGIRGNNKDIFDGKATCSWWLRTIGMDNNNAVTIHSDGRLDAMGKNVNLKDGVRPSLWIQF